MKIEKLMTKQISTCRDSDGMARANMSVRLTLLLEAHVKNMTVVRRAALAIAPLLLGACSQPAGAQPATATPATTMSRAAAPSAPAATAPFDARFIDGMIPHHEKAVVLAREALVRAEHAEIKQLAQAIIDSQQREIDQMKAWRSAWYPTLAPTAGMAMGKMGGVSPMAGMSGPMGSGPMAGMSGMDRAAGTSGAAGMGDMSHAGGASATPGMAGGHDVTSGGPYDHGFIDRMIPHHQDAITMAKQALAEAEHAEIRQLATAIIEAQQKEIDQLAGWRQSWSSH